MTEGSDKWAFAFLDTRLIDLETEGKFYPIATFADLIEALQMMGKASSEFRTYSAEWYNKVFLTGYKEAESSSVVISIKIVVNFKVIDSIKKGFVYF